MKTSLLFVLLTVILAIFASAVEATLKVGVVGLGQMGVAIVQCYDSHEVEVHAWNRGEQRRQDVKDLHLKHVQVHDTLEEVLASTDLVIMAVVGGEDLENAEALIKSVPASLWKEKTLMQYSAHEPLSARKHKEFIDSLGANLIAGAMLAMPEDVCGDEGLYMVATEHASVLEKATPTLEKMGQLVPFEDDVGLASLADIGVLQSVYFGITGFELTYLLLERYGAPPAFAERLLEICTKVMTLWFPVIAKMVYHVMSTKKWKESVDNADMGRDVFRVHAQFCQKMDVVDDIYLQSWLKYTGRIEDGTDALSRWIEFATKPGIATKSMSAEL